MTCYDMTNALMGPDLTTGERAVAIASQAIADYVAHSYECLAQIEMAKRRQVGAAKEATLAIRSVADTLTTAQRDALFADFYWDAVELPSEPVLSGFGFGSIGPMMKGLPRGRTGVPCRDCGVEIAARSRIDYRQIQAAATPVPNPTRRRRSQVLSSDLCCDACKDVDKKATRRAWEQQQGLAQQGWNERQTALRSMRYVDYLRSLEWQQTRAAALKRSRYRCQLCGAFQWVTLDVHHNTYERRGCELPADVIVLCRPCHTKHHAALPESDANQSGVRS